MLRLYLGENEDAKLKRLANAMKDDIAAGREVIAIIPDQFSFAFDKSLYAHLGIKDFNKVTVLSFKRLCAQLIERFGTDSGVLLDPSQRLILIFLALQKVKAESELRLLSRSLDKPNFIADMSEMIDSMKRSGITPEALAKAGENISGSLGDKLYDISLLYSEYEAQLSLRGYRDESSVVIEGARICEQSGYFRGKAIYLDRFDSFSPDELMLLEAAFKSAHSVNVALYLPNDCKKGAVSPYNLTLFTQSKLVSLAGSLNLPVRFIREDLPERSKGSIASVKSKLFTPSSEPEHCDGSVKIFSCDTVYDEADFVAASIRMLVSKGYTYNDIAVFTHDIKTYSRVIESAFKSYSIPAFFDNHESASGMSLIIFALSALEAASSSKPNTDRILRLVRSPFSSLNEEEVSMLEDYCLRWNVDGEMWLNDFTAEESGVVLKEVNRVRKTVILPLIKLREAVKNASARQISSAFCEYLQEVDLAKGARQIVDESEPADKLETVRLFSRLWQSLMDALSAVSLTADEEKMSAKTFLELIRLILSQTKIANPPQKLDSVTVADVSRSIISHPKIAFVIGMNDGKFPSDVKKSGMFSGKDISVLESMGIAFEPTLSFRLDSERLDCHKALSSPAELLMLSYSNSDIKGASLRPSTYITRIAKLLGIRVSKASNLNAAFYCSSPDSAYSRYAAAEKLSAYERASLREALTEIPEYRQKLELLDSLDANLKHKLSPAVAKRLFAPFDINVTASRIDVYNKCNFEYFCRYGLGIQEIQPVNMDPNVRGTVMHFVFESVLSHYGSAFSDITDDELFEAIERCLKVFAEQSLQGDFGKSAKFRADYARLSDACFDILKNIREEFKVSKFRPVRFEYTLHDSEGGSILSIPVNRNLNINIRGVVDRVDMYTDEQGNNYLRIVDYKTGEKKLRFDDIYNGLNLQMLLYMLALTEGKDADFNGCTPAGIIYMRSGFLECDDSYDPLSSESRDRLMSVTKQLKRDGLIVDDEVAIKAMDPDISGSFAPVSLKKGGKYAAASRLISKDSFKALEDFARSKVVDFGNSLLIGKIDAVPLGHDKNDIACRYCQYKSVCDRPKYKMSFITDADSERLLDIIKCEEGDKDA